MTENILYQKKKKKKAIRNIAMYRIVQNSSKWMANYNLIILRQILDVTKNAAAYYNID